MLALIGALPVAIERLVQVSMGRPTRAPRLVPLVVLVLAVLAIVPVAGWLIELIVNPITISNFVDRRAGPSTTLVEMVVRDSLQERRVALVRSPLAVEALQQRWIVARVLDDTRSPCW